MSIGDLISLTRPAHDHLQTELAGLLARIDSDDEEPVTATGCREYRIREARVFLHRAVVGEAPRDDGIAEPGMVLTVRFGDEQTKSFLLGTRDGPGAGNLETYSPDSPLGTALLGVRQGEYRFDVVLNGQTVAVTLLRAVSDGRHNTSQA